MLKKPVEIDPKMIYGQLPVIRRISFTGGIYEGGGRRHGASQIPHRTGRCTDHQEAWPGTRLTASRSFDAMSVEGQTRKCGVAESHAVIPGRREASNPESRDSPMCNCTSEVRVFDAPRNDEASRDAGKEGFFRRVDRVGGSDMHPHAIEPEAEQPLL